MCKQKVLSLFMVLSLFAGNSVTFRAEGFSGKLAPPSELPRAEEIKNDFPALVWIRGVKMIVEGEPDPKKEEIKFIGKSHGNLLQLNPVLYRGKRYWAKTARDTPRWFDDQDTYLVPQAELLHFLAQHGVKQISRVRHFLQLEDGRKVILLEEFPPGQTLRQRIVRGGVLTEAEACSLILRLARSVHSLHSLGVYHWDIKPTNVWLTDSGEIILFDFDLSFKSEEDFYHRLLGELGTMPYMSRQRLHQAYTDTPTPRPHYSAADEVYSLGVTLGAMLFGFSWLRKEDDDDDEFYWLLENDVLLRKVLAACEERGISSHLREVLTKTLSRGKSEYETVDEFIAALKLSELDESAGMLADLLVSP